MMTELVVKAELEKVRIEWVGEQGCHRLQTESTYGGRWLCS
jgi:hypothetical protein